MGITRKLEDICHSLALPVERGDIMGFLLDTKSMQRINSLLEDVHEALMDYQVCMPNCPFYTVPDTYARLHYNKISMVRVVGLL